MNFGTSDKPSEHLADVRFNSYRTPVLSMSTASDPLTFTDIVAQVTDVNTRSGAALSACDRDSRTAASLSHRARPNLDDCALSE